MSENNIQLKIKQLRCCVILPTYNNELTLCRVIDGVLNYTNNIIVINDGSTDNTSLLLENYPNIEIIHRCPLKLESRVSGIKKQHAYHKATPANVFKIVFVTKTTKTLLIGIEFLYLH